MNRGIGGQTICDVLRRLDSAIVTPRAISLLIGTNDLHGLGNARDMRAITAQMDELIHRIRVMAPSSPLFVNSVTPRSLHFRDRIAALDHGCAEIASRRGATFIDLWPALADADGALLPEMTPADGPSTSVGSLAIARFLRPVCYQGLPNSLFPVALRDDNPPGLSRRLDGTVQRG